MNTTNMSDTSTVIKQPKKTPGKKAAKQSIQFEEVAKGQDTPKKRDLYAELEAIQDKDSQKYRDTLREIETAIGVADVNPFGTTSKAIFQENLENMDLSEMQKMALKVGINQLGTKSQLKHALSRAFSLTAYSRFGAASYAPRTVDPFTKEQREKMQRALDW